MAMTMPMAAMAVGAMDVGYGCGMYSTVGYKLYALYAGVIGCRGYAYNYML